MSDEKIEETVQGAHDETAQELTGEHPAELPGERAEEPSLIHTAHTDGAAPATGDDGPPASAADQTPDGTPAANTETDTPAETPAKTVTDVTGPDTQPAAAVGDEDGRLTDFSYLKDVDTGRIDTESLPFTEAFEVGSETSGALPAAPAAAGFEHVADSMTPDPLTGAVPVLADDAVESARPVRVPAEREVRFLKRWVLILVLVAAWIPSAAVGLLLYQHWFSALLPHDRLVSVAYVLVWVFTCVVVALLLAMIETRPLVVALAFAILTAPAISVAAAGVKYGYVACTARDVPGVQSLCPEPLHSWGKKLR